MFRKKLTQSSRERVYYCISFFSRLFCIEETRETHQCYLESHTTRQLYLDTVHLLPLAVLDHGVPSGVVTWSRQSSDPPANLSSSPLLLGAGLSLEGMQATLERVWCLLRNLVRHPARLLFPISPSRTAELLDPNLRWISSLTVNSWATVSVERTEPQSSSEVLEAIWLRRRPGTL